MSRHLEDRLKDLETLPALEPPAALQRTTLAAMAVAAGAGRRRHFARAAAWTAAIGTGSLLALWVVTPRSPEPSAEVAQPVEAIYLEYVEQLAVLEEVMARLPEPRRVMRAGTASTIVGLENRIALIDAELDRARAEQGPPEYRVALMRDRAEVTNALLHVRYAQSRAFQF